QEARGERIETVNRTTLYDRRGPDIARSGFRTHRTGSAWSRGTSVAGVCVGAADLLAEQPARAGGVPPSCVVPVGCCKAAQGVVECGRTGRMAWEDHRPQRGERTRRCT